MAIKTVEHWRAVVGYENLYEVSSLGRVKRLPASGPGRSAVPKITIGTPCRLGYLRVRLTAGVKQSRKWYVHQLVAAAFLLSDPLRREVNHKNCNPSDNRLENLEYVTRSENMLHRVAAKGSAGWAHKLNDEKVREIRRLCASGMSQSEVGRLFGVASSNINAIVHRKQWKHVA